MSLRFPRRFVFIILIFGGLFALLFQYRVLSLAKRLGANVNPIGTRFPISLDLQNAPLWLSPIYQTLDYLNTVWFTTLLGLLIAGATAAFLSPLISRWLGGNGLKQHFAGALVGLPNMFCTCCAAGTLSGLKKAGASSGPALSSFVASPALNIVVIILAFELLPLKLAVARLVLGLVASVLLTYVLSRILPERDRPQLPAAATGPEPLGQATGAWIKYSWETARNVVPLLVLGIFAISVFKILIPFDTLARQFGPDLPSTALASVVGTILMVPTFTEVVWAKEFIGQGMGTSPVVALLITLPAVSFPSLWVLGKVLKSHRTALLLGLFTAALGVVGGMVFSAL